MPNVRARAQIAAVICEAAPLLASALAEVRNPGSLSISYTLHSIFISAASPEHLAEAEPQLAVAFASAGWGFTAIHGPDGWDSRTRLSFQVPDGLTAAWAYEARCLYCNGAGEQPFRGCCSARCSYFEHDKD